jgi:hypothetical protein
MNRLNQPARRISGLVPRFRSKANVVLVDTDDTIAYDSEHIQWLTANSKLYAPFDDGLVQGKAD